MAQSLSNLLQSSRQMATALEANQVEVTSRGATAEFVTAGKTKINTIETLENEQEALKAALKIKTKELNDATKELKNWQKEARQIVKLVYNTQKEKWIEFGIKAKR